MGSLMIEMAGRQTRDWSAIERWRDGEYVASRLPRVKAHAPRRSVVRMHHTDPLQPLSLLPDPVRWTMPWTVSIQPSPTQTLEHQDVSLSCSKESLSHMLLSHSLGVG